MKISNIRVQFKMALALICITPLWAHSYDLDTHFYGTYAMARFAGIKHDVASKIATGTQWMDESYISDPLSMIILPLTGIKKRRLLHFPASRVASEIAQQSIPGGIQAVFDPTTNLPLKEFTETEANHAFASEMLTEGLREGSLLKASVGLHTLEDSYAHAGTIAELGHAHFWHHPDRPYVDEQSVTKYFKMTRSVFKALVAIRSLLPDSAIDTSYKSENSTLPNSQLDAETLANLYESTPIVKNTVSRKILNDPTYVKIALKEVFNRAKNKKLITNEPANMSFPEGQDAYQATVTVLRNMPRSQINLTTLIDKQTKDEVNKAALLDDYILSMGGSTALAENVVNELLTSLVPKPMSVYHRFEKEEDTGPLWNSELELRVMNMRSMINSLFKTDIYFEHNSTKGLQGFVQEISQDRADTPINQSNPNIKVITFSAKEKLQFDRMVFSYLFPQAYEKIQDDLPQLVNLVVETDRLFKNNKNLTERMNSRVEMASEAWKALMSPIQTLRITSSLTTGIELAWTDLWESRVTPSMYNLFYQTPSLLEKYSKNNTFKKINLDK